MATVAQFIDDARFDLRDYQTGLEYDDDELLVYVNRMAKVLDSTLTALNSSFVHKQSTVALGAAVNYLDAKTNLNSGNWDSIREVWISQTMLEKIGVDHLYYKRKYLTNTGQPYYWALAGDNIQFEVTTDAIYSLTINYNQTTGTLTAASDMPYSDRFDDVFREMLVMHAKAKKEGAMSPTEQTYQAAFRRVAIELQIRTDFVPKYYRLGF